jgi:adenylosuccinate lyase
VVPGLEDVALWHERDISHSSVERIVLPDTLMLTGFVLRAATWLATGVEIDAARARMHLDETSLGLVYSQSVLLALVDHGVTRDDAYRIVQRAAETAAGERRRFREVLEADPDVGLDREELDEAFDLERLLRHRKRMLDAIASL